MAIYKIKDIMRQWNNKQRLYIMDSTWALYSGGCFGLYRPSFRYTHTDAEVKEYTKSEIGKLKELLGEYEQKLAKHK